MEFDDFMTYMARTLLMMIPAATILGVLGVIFINGIGASEGQHTGYVTAVEFNNNILWDANIAYFKTDTESTQEDRYCVNDKIVKQELEAAAMSKDHVTIKYKHPFWFWNSLCNGGDSIIIGIKQEG